MSGDENLVEEGRNHASHSSNYSSNSRQSSSNRGSNSSGGSNNVIIFKLNRLLSVVSPKSKFNGRKTSGKVNKHTDQHTHPDTQIFI